MRFGLIGAGSIGAVRIGALRASGSCSFTAIADVDEARAAALAGGARVYGRAEALIESADVDAVIIATPPPFHEPLALHAIAAGKHVLVEKPMAASVAACRRMADAARAAGLLLSVGYNHRYFAATKRVRDAVLAGEIGTLSHVRAYAGHVGLAEFKAGWMYDAETMGGGALLDNGTHIIDLVRYVMGDARQVYGHASGSVWNLPSVEDNAFALVRSDGGVNGSIQASWSEWKGYRFHIEAYGDRGMARAYYAPMMATVIRLDRPGGARTVHRDFYPRAILREKLRGWQTTTMQSFVEELDDFVATAEGRASSGRIALADDGIRAIEIAKAVYESNVSGAAVRLPPLASVEPVGIAGAG